jgi:hypothetical protein
MAALTSLLCKEFFIEEAMLSARYAIRYTAISLVRGL